MPPAVKPNREIKPCLYCKRDRMTVVCGEESYWVRCQYKKCGAQGPERINKNTAIIEWNRPERPFLTDRTKKVIVEKFNALFGVDVISSFFVSEPLITVSLNIQEHTDEIYDKIVAAEDELEEMSIRVDTQVNAHQGKPPKTKWLWKKWKNDDTAM